jgi:hypothetical protein
MEDMPNIEMDDQTKRAALVASWLDITLDDFTEKLSSMTGEKVQAIDPHNEGLVANWIGMLQEEVDPQVGIQALAMMSDSYLASVVEIFGHKPEGI